MKQSQFFGKCFELKVEFLTWMKNFSLNDILEKMNSMEASLIARQPLRDVILDIFDLLK